MGEGDKVSVSLDSFYVLYGRREANDWVQENEGVQKARRILGSVFSANFHMLIVDCYWPTPVPHFPQLQKLFSAPESLPRLGTVWILKHCAYSCYSFQSFCP